MSHSSSKPDANCIVAVHGACYLDNFGDILLLQLLVRAIRAEFPGCRVAMPFAPKRAADKIGADLVGTKYLCQCDAFVFSGGGYFGEPDRGKARWSVRNFFRYILPGLVAAALRKPMFVVGVGAGPIGSKILRRSIKTIFSRTSFASVRDPESIAFLTEIGVAPSKLIQTADLALSIADEAFRRKYLPELEELARSEKNPSPLRTKIGLHFNNLRSGTFEEKLTKELIDRFGAAKVVAVNDQGVPPGATAAKALATSPVPYGSEVDSCFYEEPAHFIHKVSQLEVVLTKKLHVGIIACAMGVPTAAIPMHSKIFRFYRQIGKADSCIPIGEASVGTIASTLGSIRGQKWEIPRNVIEESLKNLTFLPVLRATLDPKGSRWSPSPATSV